MAPRLAVAWLSATAASSCLHSFEFVVFKIRCHSSVPIIHLTSPLQLLRFGQRHTQLLLAEGRIEQKKRCCYELEQLNEASKNDEEYKCPVAAGEQRN